MTRPKILPTPAQATEKQLQTPTTPKLSAMWLQLLRLLWFGVAGLTLGMFVVGSFFFFRLLLTVPTETRLVTEQLFPEEVALFGQWGVSLWTYATYRVVLEALFFLPIYALCLLLFWRKANEPIAIFVSLILMAYGAQDPTADDALAALYPGWFWVVESIQALGYGGGLLILYLFPDGRFVPRWTRVAAVIWSLLISGWLLFPTFPANPIREPVGTGPSLFMVIFNGAWFLTGIYALAVRYRGTALLLQRQQTKWVLLGFIISFVGALGFYLARAFWSLYTPGRWSFDTPGAARFVDIFIGEPILTFTSLALPITFGVAILRYHLWDIDFIIRRTLIYGTLTGILTLIYVGTVTLFQGPLRALLGSRSDLAIVASTLLIALLFQPLRQHLQTFIDRRFYRDKVDFQRAFTDFARELRLIIELPELLRVLSERITGLLHSAHGAIFMRNADGRLEMAAASQLPAAAVGPLSLDDGMLAQLQAGLAVTQPKNQWFALLLPLTTPRAGGVDLVGVLALGPRLSEQPYRREDLVLLTTLAEQAGTAIAVAQSIQIKQRLEAHHNSASGRAETLARELLAHPATAVYQLHHLAQAAGQEPNAASILANVPQALTHVAHLDGSAAAETDLRILMGLASGYHDLLRSQVTPEILAIALRTIVAQLEQPPAKTWPAADVGLAVYRQCQAALAVDNIAQLATLTARWSDEQQVAGTPFDRLALALSRLRPVADAVCAYERVTAVEDKLAYLVSAIERLGQIQPEPLMLERVITQGITARWAAIFTAALRALSIAAHLEITLITRQVVAAEEITLAFTLTNAGRGPAINIHLELLPDEAFALVTGKASVAELLPAQSVQCSFTIRPATHGVLRPGLRIHYADQEGVEKSLVFAAPVQLLPVPATFTPIPNFYSPGIPLRSNSPVFFGRKDLLAFIGEAVHQIANGRVLVLAGERRMGKTSLAQQLPGRLQRECVTVYMDCQSLAIDPGIEGFFYDVVLEIADTLGLPAPDVTNFATRPVAFFAREFLPRALAAAGDRPLILLFDEYEELELRVANGKLPVELFSFLRHLMQHEDRLGFIFIGAHRLAELNPGYWSAFFNVALHRQVGCLPENTTRTVITQPVESYLFYEDLALDKMWRLTAGHPYFLQLLCHTLVNEANRAQRNYVLIEHLNLAVAQVVELGEAHFLFLWAQLRPLEQRLLHMIATQTSHTVPLTPAGFANHLGLTEEDVVGAVAGLVEREILRPVGGPTPGYEFVLDMLRLWIQRRLY